MAGGNDVVRLPVKHVSYAKRVATSLRPYVPTPNTLNRNLP